MKAMKRKNVRNNAQSVILKAPDTISPAEECTFQAMRVRARDRKKYGPYVETTGKIHLVMLGCLLIYTLSQSSSFDPSEESTGDDIFISLSVIDVLVICGSMLVFALITMLISSRLKTPFYILVIYIPFIHNYFWEYDDKNEEEEWALFMSLSISEGIVILFVIGRELLYPIFIKSEWMRKKIASIWSIQVITPWTMAYRGKWGWWGDHNTCMYDGEKDEEGYPHGMGRWFDDMYGGEILSGRWEKGIPVAPFVSRTYGQGDGFTALHIAYFVSSDDSFSKSSGTPSNENEPTLGVATVECSVNGHFYSHLPLVKEGKVLPVSNEDGSVVSICKKLVHLEENDNELEEVEIRVDAARRLHVNGHVYAPPTGNPRSLDSDQIIVDIKRCNKDSSPAIEEKPQYMPRVSLARSIFDLRGSAIPVNNYMILQDVLEEEEEEFLASDVEPQNDNTIEEENGLLNINCESFQETEVNITSDIEPQEDNNRKDMSTAVNSNKTFNKPMNVAKLEVRDWTRNQLKEALIFFPGFNSSIEKSLKSLGQFIALSQLDRHIYPILYAWPAGTLPSYRSASNISATQKNKDNFHLLLRGLQDEGIYTVHLMGHSMGTQSLLAMFEDKYDNNLPSRSDASMMFQHDPAFSDDTEVQGTGKELMVCKNIIFMNPDFPVEAFVDRAFLSIRRVCQNITLLGDRKDVALMLGSKLINGACNKLGYIQPDLLRSNKSLKSHSKEFQYHTIGTDIDLLYFPEAHDDMNQDQKLLDKEIGEKNPTINNALIFDSVAPIHCTLGESCIDKQWLDIDVIDTTSLDTNVAGVRHGGFHVNPIIIKDLEELIVGGHRAHLRLSLLNREGNLHTYSHAPAHVTL